MLLREDEARTKWCRHVRAPLFDNRAAQQPGEEGNPIPGTVCNAIISDRPHCIASDCMAWRWQMINLDKTDLGFCGADAHAPKDAFVSVVI